MIKEFLIKKMLKAKGVPADQIDPLLEIINKNPALFQTIAGEVEVKVKQGLDQNVATMAVLQKYQTELREIFPK